VASIPVWGWAAALGVAAATFAGLQSYQTSASASAAEGYDVPPGVAPVTQLHPREMVLPASLADTVRQMATTSGAPRGRAPTVNFPGRAVGNLFTMHMDDLKGAINQLVRSHHGRAGAF